MHHRLWVFAVTLVLLFTPVWAQVGGVESIGMTVANMDKSVQFYHQVLAFEKVSDVEVMGENYEKLQGIFGLRMRVVRMKLGDETLVLTEYITPKGRPIPIDSKSYDHWFQHIAIVVRDMNRAYQKLREYKVQHVSTGPQRLPEWNKAAAGIEAFYFQDPDGHNLEVIYFPQGKGDPKWQRPTDKLFLGIDHTAIVVENTTKSLNFYQELLGLRVAGESENYGTEQEHLNQVFGARLHITGLRAVTGPGIEFLEYLSPPGGRAYPSDTQSNDLWHWQTTLTVIDLPSLLQNLHKGQTSTVSPGLFSAEALGFKQGALVRDPDGHGLLLVKP
ncbi:VOC family protein [Anthocerotibacter panamensis]|uniref:VOC family protein n=1 Tax=Anthocerotibacter panamensis TaxID=2857077 RepID=UPI001C403D52|nr:VOC family protein [Anthocerotibacter panamensis]